MYGNPHTGNGYIQKEKVKYKKLPSAIYTRESFLSIFIIHVVYLLIIFLQRRNLFSYQKQYFKSSSDNIYGVNVLHIPLLIFKPEAKKERTMKTASGYTRILKRGELPPNYSM